MCSIKWIFPNSISVHLSLNILQTERCSLEEEEMFCVQFVPQLWSKSLSPVSRLLPNKAVKLCRLMYWQARWQGATATTINLPNNTTTPTHSPLLLLLTIRLLYFFLVLRPLVCYTSYLHFIVSLPLWTVWKISGQLTLFLLFHSNDVPR